MDVFSALSFLCFNGSFSKTGERKMGKILLVNQDKDLLELARLGLEEKTSEEVIVARTAIEAIGILNKAYDFSLVICDNESEVLNFLISQKSTVPFFYFTDDISLKVPYTSYMFIGVWRKIQFLEMCDSVTSILRRPRR